jgi:hypothetical protein
MARIGYECNAGCPHSAMAQALHLAARWCRRAPVIGPRTGRFGPQEAHHYRQMVAVYQQALHYQR